MSETENLPEDEELQETAPLPEPEPVPDTEPEPMPEPEPEPDLIPAKVTVRGRRVLSSWRGIPYDLARERLALWLEAEAAVATGQAYTIGSRSLTRASLGEIRKSIEYWAGIVSKCESGCAGIRIQHGITR